MPGTDSYSLDGSRLGPFIALLTVITVAMAVWALFVPGIALSTRAILLIVSVVIALAVVRAALSLSDDRPSVVVSGDGIRLPRTSEATIPWSGVEAIFRTKVGRTEILNLTLDAATYRDLPRRRVPWLFRSRTLGVSLSSLEGSPDDIAANVESRWRAARAAAPGSFPLGESSPPSAALTLNRPWATYALLGLLAIVYACELAFPVTPSKGGSPSVLTLAYLGGNIGDRVWGSGEWWRLFTAPLLHASPTHILLNGFVLWIAGTSLERLVGWRWLGAIFALSALGGSFGSLAVNAPDLVGVGASGGIMGLLAAMFVVSWRLPLGAQRMRLQIRAGQTIIPSLLPILSTGKGGMTIDYAAHGGGVIVGAIIAIALLRLWPRDRGTPPLGLAAAIVASAYFLVAAGSILPIMNLRGNS